MRIDLIPRDHLQQHRKIYFFFLVGFIFFPVIYHFSLSNYVFSFLDLAIHELGHITISILLGCPSIPIINPLTLEGATYTFKIHLFEFIPLMMGAVFLWFIIINRKRKKYFYFFFILLCGYIFANTFHKARVVSIDAAGIIFEFIGAVLCLTASLAQRPKWYERIIYSSWGWHLTLGNFLFLSRLLRNPSFRNAYAQGTFRHLLKGTEGDLSRIAHLMSLPLLSVINLSLVLCLSAPFFALFAIKSIETFQKGISFYPSEK